MPRNRHSLTIRAGHRAYREIRENGLDISRIGTMAGASGGAKWLVLSQLDRVVLNEVLPRLKAPVHLLGSSIGSWRFACYTQADPVAAINRFEEAYLEQRYSENPDRDEITERTSEILDYLMGDSGVDEALSNDLMHSHILTVRARHLLAAEHPFVLGAGLLTAAALNAVSRSTLGAFFERALFTDERDNPPFSNPVGFPLQRIGLSAENYKEAVLASGSIPLVLNGVQDIPGARKGMYRDGGVIDYHLDLPQSEPDRLTLFLHFYDYIVPGWFDKAWTRRRPDPANVAGTILISPSAEFVSRLPNQKIPDRHDFENFEPAVRRRAWREVVTACEELADEFLDILETGDPGERLKTL